MEIKLATDFEKNKIIYEDLNNIFNSRNYWENFNNKSILITGAYGSIARFLSYFFLHLIKNYKFKIKLYLNGRNKNKMNEYFGRYSSYFNPVFNDLSKNMTGMPEKIDIVIHAASNARPDLFATRPVETIIPNVIGLNSLLEKYKTARFLFFSTGSVYGKIKSDNITEDSQGVINHYDVMSSYAESKRMGELLCKSYAEEYGVDIRIVRIHHTYGPTLDLIDDNRTFSYFVKCAIKNENIVLNSDGTAKRAFLYISDAILAFCDILILGNKTEVYNMSAYSFTSIVDLARIVVKINGRICVEIKPKEIYVDSNSNRVVVSSVEKLKKLGWRQTINIENGFSRTINSFKYN